MIQMVPYEVQAKEIWALLHKTLQSNLSQKIKPKSDISQSESSIPILRFDFLT